MAAPNQIDPSYPWEGYYHSGSAPDGGDEAVAKVIKQGLAAIAPILEAGAAAYGVSIEQVSPSYSPSDPNLEDSERAYVARFQPALADASPAVAAIRGTVPRRTSIPKMKKSAAGAKTIQGLGADTSAVIKDAAKQAGIDAIKHGAAQTLTTSLGAAGAAGLAVQGANLLMDPKGAFASKDSSLATTAGLASAAAVAVGAPVIGWAIGAGMAVKALLDFGKSKGHAEREEERWDHLIKSIKSASNILVKEAQTFANNLVAHGVPIANTGDAARLEAHYKAQTRAYQAKTTGYDDFKRQFPALQAKYLVENKAWHEKDDAARRQMMAEQLAQKEAAFKAALARLGRDAATIEKSWLARKPIEETSLKANFRSWRGIPGKPPAPGERLASLQHDANRIGRTQSIRIMLQAARDFRILNDLMALEPAAVSAALVGQAAGQLSQANPKLTTAPAKQTYAAVAAAGPVREPAAASATTESTKTPPPTSGSGAGAALAAGAALVTLVALGEDGGDDMFFGINGLGAAKANRAAKAAAKAAVKTAKVEAKKTQALKRIELRSAAQDRAAALLAKRKEVSTAKKIAKLEIAKVRQETKVIAAKQKAEASQAKRAARLAKVRDQAAQAVAQGATPEAAASSAMAYDAQQNPGVPLVYSQAQVEPMMQASASAEPAASGWATPLPEQSQEYVEQPVAEEDDPWAIQMPAGGGAVAQPWDELQYDPSVTQAAEAELVEVGDEGDAEYQEAAGAIEAEGSLTPYPGEEIPAVTGEDERTYEIQEVPQQSFRARGFFGMGAAAQARVVAKRAAAKAVAKGAKPAEAVAVASQVARRFFAQKNFFGMGCRRA